MNSLHVGYLSEMPAWRRPIGWPKKLAQNLLYALTLPNINRFSKLFHCQNQEKICNNTMTEDPTIHLECVATLPCEMSMS